MAPSTAYIGKGIYGISEAARLLRRPAASVRRWANGYTYSRPRGAGQVGPVLQTPRQDQAAITFQELIELFFVREYVSAGIALKEIRSTAEALSKEYGPHPFAARPLVTDGRRLLKLADYGYISPATCQLVADFAQEFVREISFEDDFVHLWHPKEGLSAVVVDPARSLGEPILEATGTPTRTIFRTYLKEQSFEVVADYYDIDFALIKRAVEFELRFSNAA